MPHCLADVPIGPHLRRKSVHRAPGFRLPEIALNEIDLSGLVAVRQVLRRYGAQDHSRWVFRGTLAAVDGPVFVKLWNPGYVRAQTLPEALAAGFYDAANVPALRALVVSGGLCRGYVMAACGHRLRMGRGFFDLICRRTAETRLCRRCNSARPTPCGWGAI